jgi:hypothetical protein
MCYLDIIVNGYLDIIVNGYLKLMFRKPLTVNV